MGVYHLMGLGRSVGAVTGPISFLTYQYFHNQAFFNRSGEAKQREEGKKVGDIQAMIFFTTQEVLEGKLPEGRPFFAYSYYDNAAGQIPKHPQEIKAGPMKETLKTLLTDIWKPTVLANIVENSPQKSKMSLHRDLYWVEIDRRNLLVTFERIALIVKALQTGKEGKEIWMNLTGGNNITNFALQLAANLTGEVARLYYIQAHNQDAERCIRYTAEDGYWVEIPVMPLGLEPISYAILLTLSMLAEPVSSDDLYGLMKSDPAQSLYLYTVSKEQFEHISLKHLWKQGLLTESSKMYKLGPQWEVFQPYIKILQDIQQEKIILKELASQVDWLTEDNITFS